MMGGGIVGEDGDELTTRGMRGEMEWIGRDGGECFIKMFQL